MPQLFCCYPLVTRSGLRHNGLAGFSGDFQPASFSWIALMEHVLIKMARQLDALDEASLLALWEQYAHKVANFEPSKRWEEAALVFSLIQAKHWKNQLFNHNLAAQMTPAAHMPGQERPFAPFSLETQPASPKHRATVLQFKPRDAAVTDTESSPPDPADPSAPPQDGIEH